MLTNQPDMVLKKDGKMMVVRHGEMEPLDMIMTLDNGARVFMDGTVTMPDGTSRMLTDGEAITMDGEPTTAVDSQAGNKMDE
jgi:hypothetical protein